MKLTRRAALRGLLSLAALPLAACRPADPQRYTHKVVSSGPVDVAAVGRAYSEHLARSLTQTRETMAANILNNSFNHVGNRMMPAAEFSAMLRNDLNAVFRETYL